MAGVQDHYETLLADHYTWMFGVPFEQKVEEQAGLLRRAGVDAPGTAIDLGCGSGFQSMALCRLGARKVYAVDTSRKLLDELAGRADGVPVETVHGDLLAFRSLVRAVPDTIVCMGDTLTHLPDRRAVDDLFGMVAAVLPTGGRFVLGYRDLDHPLAGVDRFIPLRGTADKIMTCFLEHQGDVVMVHDLVHVRDDDGWRLFKSVYPKLVLPLAEIRRSLEAHGLDVTFEETARGMSLLGMRRV